MSNEEAGERIKCMLALFMNNDIFALCFNAFWMNLSCPLLVCHKSMSNVGTPGVSTVVSCFRIALKPRKIHSSHIWTAIHRLIHRHNRELIRFNPRLSMYAYMYFLREKKIRLVHRIYVTFKLKTMYHEQLF